MPAGSNAAQIDVNLVRRDVEAHQVPLPGRKAREQPETACALSAPCEPL
ncbi:hypothetical protein GZL_00984 [Streptomyces sp. 769]|nr:hypothetical protein GZL_00984 [Streptomyces sp. 769]